MALPIAELGRRIVAKRGKQGVRAAAEDVGISSATLSRVENGNVPDLLTFKKICNWLKCDPREFLGDTDETLDQSNQAVVHFRKDKTVAVETAQALAELILAAQRALQARDNYIRQ